eukprot:gene39600-48927_t
MRVDDKEQDSLHPGRLLKRFKETLTFHGITLENFIFPDDKWLLESPLQLDVRLGDGSASEFYLKLYERCIFPDGVRIFDMSTSDEIEDDDMNRQ